ncbi:hypothetical protein AaE_001201 [Aphanomyces astaci]|uniref:Uncharacterized protein n=1 Tax=Aphanomyces astaci TaxID=112090 RepID=A0A6A5AX15_APHAT|nr:hypothetical protein AaE_001201 [Aphanomyces astaci]
MKRLHRGAATAALLVVCEGAKQGTTKGSSSKMTMDDFLYMLGMLQVVIIGPMVLFFVVNLVRDPAFLDVVKGLWTTVRSRTLSDLSASAPVQHAPPSTSARQKDPRYTN